MGRSIAEQGCLLPGYPEILGPASPDAHAGNLDLLHADLLQLHPPALRNQWVNTGTDGKHPDQSDGKPVGNDDWVGNNKIKQLSGKFFLYSNKLFNQ